MDHDIVIIGAGPAGLALACALARTPLRVAVVEKQPEASLADPPFDGREIALTHRSARILHDLGLWARIPEAEVSALRDARILNGASPYALEITHADGRAGQLGYLVSNHLIRRAAYEAARDVPRLTLRSGTKVTGIRSDGTAARLSLETGEQLAAPLVVAADSRFSETRRAMGIAASMHDFGRTMLVCRMTHAIAHDQVAWEWFDYGQTLALLPLNGCASSVVITVPHHEIERLLALDEAAFARDVERRFAGRLGRMQLASTRHAYPLVGVYPRRFVAQRFAVVGDAAVGMHPVTAHGYNLGLVGVELLADAIRSQLERGEDIGSSAMLGTYERRLRRATRPLYLATRAIASLYTRETPPARLLRGAALRIANRVPPFRRLVATALTATAGN
jgi:ubiquinone biosynthesis UbiH/UbiF/VisC/COQ6 family hydroxylase